jgi:hypothetical protein
MDIRKFREAITIARNPECVQGKGVRWTITIPYWLIPKDEELDIRVISVNKDTVIAQGGIIMSKYGDSDEIAAAASSRGNEEGHREDRSRDWLDALGIPSGKHDGSSGYAIDIHGNRYKIND